MKKRLRILLLSPSTAPIPDVLGGGAERLVTILIEQNEIEHRVDFCVTSPDNKIAREKSMKYKHTKFIYISKNSLLDKAWNLVVKILRIKFSHSKILKKGYYHKVLTQIKKEEFDFVIDENGYVPEVDYFTKHFGKNKVLAHIHWQVNPVSRNIDGLYGGIIGVSNFVADEWKRNSKDNDLIKKIVFSSVDESSFKIRIDKERREEWRRNLKINHDDIVFIYCGRLNEQKGVFELIHSFRQIDNCKTKLLVVGGSYLKGSQVSDYEKKLWDIAKEDQRIVFTGYIDNKELYKYYGIADIQVIPTVVEEAAGLVAIEGMMSGLPIIATDSGGLPEYIDDSCSIIVHREKLISELCDAMKLLLSSKPLIMRMAGQARLRADRFSKSKYYNDFVNSLEQYSEAIT